MNIEFKLNNKLNGIEIYFESCPDKSVLDKLHEMKWRWHGGKRCWYNKQNEKNIEFAKSICDGNFTVSKEDSKDDFIIKNIHGVSIGDIYYTSYGYDMTLVDFYQVVSVTAKRATVRAIKSDVVSGSGGYSGRVMPVKDVFIDDKTITTGTDKSWDGKSSILKNCNGNMGYKFMGSSISFNCMD